MINKAGKLLKTIFGYDEFRPLQQDIILSALNKKDTLVIMPTGGGKSLCYQIPAMIFEGLTIVVSPLISLMKDQVDQLHELGIDAILLNSTLSFEEYQKNINLIQEGMVKLLYVAPETLLKPDILSILTSVRIDCIAIDEAHCISEWGHDFRPEYRQLKRVKTEFPDAVCMALTATATARVREDIKKNLDFKNSRDFIASFNRENLFFEVIPKEDPLAQTLEFLKNFAGQSGIIYCFSRSRVDNLYERLKDAGHSVKPYHAGLPDEERRQNQELFIKDRVQIIVATIAFGMGIHKTNVRFVIHFDLPKSIESYYQETGRAGRDGLPAHCLLLYSYGDIYKIKYLINQKADEGEIRVANEHLAELVKYADTDLCRRIPLITYFGEDYSAGNCDMCDNCKSPREQTDITTQAQMFFSCIKRTGERFGASHIIDILRGSESKKTIQNSHNRLSTYGIGKEYSKRQWHQMFRQFIRKGLIYQDMEDYSSLKLTPLAYDVMKNLNKVTGHMDQEKNIFESPAQKPVQHDKELFDSLRAKRRELADAANVPPYIIFSDKTLFEMSSLFPQSRESLLGIHGIGQSKQEKYGDIFLEIILEYCRQRGIEDQSRKAAPKPKALATPKYIIVSNEYNAGNSIEEIAKKYNIKIKTILGHLYRFIQDGNNVRSDGLLEIIRIGDEERKAVLNSFDKHGTQLLRPVFDGLNGRISFDDLDALRVYYLSAKSETIAS